MNQLIVKQFEGATIRTHLDENGDVWFVTKDIMELLGIKSQAHALRKLENKQRGEVLIQSPSGQQQYSAVSESGLYALIFQSRKQSALKFQDWVTSEVLPSIRKTGSYQKEVMSPLDILENHVRQMRALEKKNSDMAEQLIEVREIAKQDHDTLDADQITELDEMMHGKAKKLGDWKEKSRMQKRIKQHFFNITGSRTWKEIPRHGFEEAKQIVDKYGSGN